MISDAALEFVDSTTLTISGVFAFFALAGGFYAVPWSRYSPSESASKEYNKLWTVRLCLQATATAWLLCPFIQHYHSWSSYVPALHCASLTQEALCRVYTVLRVGLLEPFFLFLTLLTFRQFLSATEESVLSKMHSWWIAVCLCSCLPTLRHLSRESGGARDKKQPRNSRIIATAGAWALLVCLTQLIVPALKPSNARDVEDDLKLPRATLMPYLDSSVCWNKEGTIPCVACVLPLVSTLISAVVVGCYLFHSWRITVRMGRIAINQYIEKRMRLFRSAVCVLLFSSVLFRALSIAWKPGHVLHEFCKLTDFLSMLFFVVALSFILVIRPIREARIADRNTKSVTITLCKGCFCCLCLIYDHIYFFHEPRMDIGKVLGY